MNIYVHHHGELNYDGINCYNGGIVDVIPKFDIDLLSFRDLLEFARDYKYDLNSLVYYQYDGHSFAKGVMLLYDDDSVRCMTQVFQVKGTLSSLSATKPGSIAIQSVFKRANVDPALVQRVFFGNVLSANLGQAPARQAAL
ncbi:hypothetical protein DCAR_0311366 [Daucus carota subsp. sativus]|uniref:PB1-like domain-containing protein n=1 Tax=Daucus carota subsp. sativus TaxID=79200 RepID=A0AAF0WLG8_DAUCS|nr:hypothetical protein DCAR_0311366 [Daucus carota subsp. sativus]